MVINHVSVRHGSPIVQVIILHHICSLDLLRNSRSIQKDNFLTQKAGLQVTHGIPGFKMWTIYIYMDLSIYVNIYVYYIYIYVSIFIYIYVCVYTNINNHKYMYNSIYVCIYIYIFVYRYIIYTVHVSNNRGCMLV